MCLAYRPYDCVLCLLSVRGKLERELWQATDVSGKLGHELEC